MDNPQFTITQTDKGYIVEIKDGPQTQTFTADSLKEVVGLLMDRMQQRHAEAIANSGTPEGRQYDMPEDLMHEAWADQNDSQ